MRQVILMCLFCTLTAEVWAQDTKPLETYHYRVNNVASDDVLNIRRMPNAHSKIVGSFAWNESLVTIVKLSADGKWGMIPSDGDKWVRMKYLQAIPLEVFTDTNIPFGLKCFGWDPTWTITFAKTFISFTNGMEKELKASTFTYERGEEYNDVKFKFRSNLKDFEFQVSREICETTSSAKYPYSIKAWDFASNQPLNRMNGKPLYGGECCTVSKSNMVVK